MNTIKRQELEAWQDYLVGKPCPRHPHSLIKDGRYGLYCGNKNERGVGCDGGWPSEEWLQAQRKEQYA